MSHEDTRLFMALCSALVADRLGTGGLCAGCGRLWRRRSGPFVVALFIGARDHGTGFQIFFHQVFAAATRAFFRNRLVRLSKLALRIIAATVARIPFASA